MRSSTPDDRDENMARTITMRVKQSNLNLIERAASYSGKNRSEFFLEAALNFAEEIFLNSRYFRLDDEAWQKFNEILDRPVQKNKKLKKLLETEDPWG